MPGLGVPALGQPGEMLGTNRPLKSPLLREPALPFAVSLLVPAPVVRLLGRELAGMVRSRLAAGKGFGDRQHVLRSLPIPET